MSHAGQADASRFLDRLDQMYKERDEQQKQHPVMAILAMEHGDTESRYQQHLLDQAEGSNHEQDTDAKP